MCTLPGKTNPWQWLKEGPQFDQDDEHDHGGYDAHQLRLATSRGLDGRAGETASCSERAEETANDVHHPIRHKLLRRQYCIYSQLCK